MGVILTCGYGEECVGASAALKELYSTVIPADVQSMLDSPDKIDRAIGRVALLKSSKGTGLTPKVLTAEARGVMDKAIKTYGRIVGIVGTAGVGELWWFEGEGGSSSASAAEGGGRHKRRTRRSRHGQNGSVKRRSSRRLRRVVQTRRAYGRGRAQRTRSSRRDRRTRR